MIPAFLAPVAAKIMANLASKTTKLIIVGALLALLAGIFFYYKHQVYIEGYNDAVKKYEERDARTREQSQRILKYATETYQKELIDQKERHANAIETYANHINDLKRDAADVAVKRMFVNTKATRSSCDSSTLPAASNAGSETNRRSESVQIAELTPRDSQAIHNAAVAAQRLNIACQAILDSLGY